MGASRVPGTVVLVVLSLVFVAWLLGLATSEPQFEGPDGNLIVCRSVSDASNLDEGSEPGGTAALACGRLRDRRLWWTVLVAMPTTVLLTASARSVYRVTTERPRGGDRSRRNEEPQL